MHIYYLLQIEVKYSLYFILKMIIKFFFFGLFQEVVFYNFQQKYYDPCPQFKTTYLFILFKLCWNSCLINFRLVYNIFILFEYWIFQIFIFISLDLLFTHFYLFKQMNHFKHKIFKDIFVFNYQFLSSFLNYFGHYKLIINIFSPISFQNFLLSSFT